MMDKKMKNVVLKPSECHGHVRDPRGDPGKSLMIEKGGALLPEAAWQGNIQPALQRARLQEREQTVKRRI